MRTFTMVLALMLGASVHGELSAQELPDARDVERALRAMVVGPTSADRDRAVVRRFLERDDVRAAAAERGVDLDGARARVATLDAPAAADLAARVEDVDRQLAGGQVVITSTAIIIALLVVILLILVD